MRPVAPGKKDTNTQRTDVNQGKTTRKSPGPRSSHRKKAKKPSVADPEKRHTDLNERPTKGSERAAKQVEGEDVVDPSKDGGAVEMTTSTMQSQSQDKSKPTNQAVPPITETSAGAEEENSDEDLYRGAEEIKQERQKKDQSCSGIQTGVAAGEEQCSVAAPVDLLYYSEREWRGNTTKSVLIRKGYTKVSQKYEGLRRVRGDNYCALRATLFQLLSQSNQLPAWIENQDISLWPKKLLSEEELVGQWRFPFEIRSATGGAVDQLGHYLGLLKRKLQEAVQARGVEERERLCQQVFQGQQEEYGLLEALKFLMLRTAMELHSAMERSADVPEFCWLLFARDSSHCPRTFLTNHLRQVGFTGGLEQVEMFLLGYSLQQTIQVYRLYQADTEEFITYYPNDHRADWPCLCLVTEDDRHYNVPTIFRM